MAEDKKKIGILALQGAFAEHIQAVRACGGMATEVRRKEDLTGLAGLILPGGESTTISRLLRWTGLGTELAARARAGFPLYGTCAGLILLAREVVGEGPPTLGLLDLTVRRNAYGRQVESFSVPLSVPVLGEPAFPAVFIRAPRIERIGREIEVLAELEGFPVLVRQGHLLASAFHPELTGDWRVHAYFLSQIVAGAGASFAGFSPAAANNKKVT